MANPMEPAVKPLSAQEMDQIDGILPFVLPVPIGVLKLRAEFERAAGTAVATATTTKSRHFTAKISSPLRSTVPL